MTAIWRTINVSGGRSYLLPTKELLVAEEKGKVSCVVLHDKAGVSYIELT
ncbi:MAG: hypothetical protein LBQ39_08405 [Tannerellaceae bacterium]|nr:hypothetical protein [Tannerellaceae bacterium]